MTNMSVFRRRTVFLSGWLLLATGAAWAQSEGPLPDVEIQSEAFISGFEKIGAVTYREIEGEVLSCDIYLPDGVGPLPAIVAIHGGAWRHGTKLTMLRHAWKLARAGYVVVAINYRHAPEHPFPAQVHDCKYAVKWIRANAKRFKIDPERIGAFGYSAGGHLAAMLGTAGPKDGLEPEFNDADSDPVEPFSSQVSAVVAGGAVCEFGWIAPQDRTLVYWLGAKKSQDPEIYRRASPMSYVSPADPPFYFYHGEHDLVVPKTTSIRLHETLQAAGVTSQHDIARNLGHVATFSDLSWMTRAIHFFDRHLK